MMLSRAVFIVWFLLSAIIIVNSIPPEEHLRVLSEKEREDFNLVTGKKWDFQKIYFADKGFAKYDWLNHDLVIGAEFYKELVANEKTQELEFFIQHEMSHNIFIIFGALIIWFWSAEKITKLQTLKKLLNGFIMFLFSILFSMSMEVSADIKACHKINNLDICHKGLDFLDSKLSRQRQFSGIFKINSHPPISVRKWFVHFFHPDWPEPRNLTH